MQNDKAKFKKDFKGRLYGFTLKLIAFLDTLPKDNVSLRLGDQLLRSGTSVIANHVEGQAAEWFLSELDEISKIFASSILTLKGKR